MNLLKIKLILRKMAEIDKWRIEIKKLTAKKIPYNLSLYEDKSSDQLTING